ncbi:MAG: hypothetical protein RJB66_926 [Pseudomonadota bacterium]|jgi:hypothetical protein
MIKYFLAGVGVAGVILGLIACAPAPKAEEPCNFVQNVYGQRISWKDQVPIPLLVHADFPREHLPALDRAIQVWESAAGHRLFAIINTSFRDNDAPTKDNRSVIYWMRSWESEKKTEQARTSIYWIGEQIREADLKVNAKDFSFYSDSPQQNSEVHLESLLIHELGHVLGLRHNDDGGSVMATYLATITKRDELSTADKDSMACEYK